MAAQRTTPIRKQYLQLKAQYPDTILFFRLGDFYETFDEDAKLAARELDITLTSRPVAKGVRIPMAGVPHHAVEGYIARRGEPPRPGVVVLPSAREMRLNRWWRNSTSVCRTTKPIYGDQVTSHTPEFLWKTAAFSKGETSISNDRVTVVPSAAERGEESDMVSASLSRS